MTRMHDTHGEPLQIGSDIAERFERVGVEALRIASALPKHRAYRNVADQLVRAATAGGANYEEARAAQSRADFIHKLSLSAKELREAAYWLRLARGADAIPHSAADALIDEVTQLAAIVVASIRTARTNARRSGVAG